jgi:hypothetical protein
LRYNQTPSQAANDSQPYVNQSGDVIHPSTIDNSDNPNVSYEGPGVINSGSPFVGRKGYKPPQQGNQSTGKKKDFAQQMIDYHLNKLAGVTDARSHMVGPAA